MAKDGGGELQPEQDGEPRREQPAEVEVLPALGHHGRAREACERNGSPHKCCHQDAEKYVQQEQQVNHVSTQLKRQMFTEGEQQQSSITDFCLYSALKGEFSSEFSIQHKQTSFHQPSLTTILSRWHREPYMVYLVRNSA